MNQKLNTTEIIIRKKENIESNILGDELVIMNVETGKYITLNNIATVIWEKLEQPTTAENLIQHLISRFDVNEDQCARETYAFLEKLKEQGLIS
ncbi:PqqD family peptide modification chaperone [Emticicia sp. TH156]|uniref:PqqD family peptide modification chaperone n=1 Tax=Emticicia sp. TH156 TaxID=2067454 RepID=UPI000C771335|nr:PqqD family peptide modification chaperone [Emticicia sp. TH156]PLK42216.1 hypothetical protein C0V77_22145 [Emticicia sp. TH156]